MLINYSPIIKQYLNIKKKYKNFLLFYQIGDFYELFFKDAEEVSNLLNFQLTYKRFVKYDNVPMAGIPIHCYKKYIIKLIKLGKSIAICNQIDNLIDYKNKLKLRKVIKIITPGTISENYYLNKKSDNYIASIWKESNNCFSFSLLDIFSGKFYILILNSLYELKIELLKNNPSEIICYRNNFNLLTILNYFKCFNFISKSFFSYKKCLNILLKHFNLCNLNCFDIDINNKFIIKSLGSLLGYVKYTQFIDLVHINNIKLVNKFDYIYIDYNSLRNLEIIDSINGNKYTLLYLLDSTLTPMGSRLLKRWLINPISNLDIINYRHNIMNIIWSYNDKLRIYLKRVGDLERIIGKICLKNVNSKDLINLKIYFNFLLNILDLFKIKDIFKYKNFNLFFNKKKILIYIINLIKNSIVNPKNDLDNLILKGYNSKLDKYKKFVNNSFYYINNIEKNERSITKINNLSIKYNKLYGFHIRINNSYLNLVPNYYIEYSSLKNYKIFFFSKLKKFEIKLLNIKKKILLLEKFIFNEILNKIIKYIGDLKFISDFVSELDVLSCFVYKSINLNFKKPIFVNYSYLKIINGRHPILEYFLNDKFISNNLLINKYIRTLLITGPNMGGKSTYMRQIAIICIMAYIGIYVPASKCYIGIIDKILTRIGFSDNILSNESTFMVEMSDISYIINNSTKNSLVLIDEMGRGTSYCEGISLAWSCLYYISKKIKCITLFSTHFYELVKIKNLYKNIKLIYFDFININNNIVFLYKIKNGICSNSCSFFVAYKSGIPKFIIDISLVIFKRLNILLNKDIDNLNFIINNKNYIKIFNIIKKIKSNLSFKDLLNKVKEIKKFL